MEGERTQGSGLKGKKNKCERGLANLIGNVIASSEMRGGFNSTLCTWSLQISSNKFFKGKRRGRKIGIDWLLGMRFPFGVIKMSWNSIEVMTVQHCECIKCYWIVQFKMVKMVNLSYVNFTSIQKIYRSWPLRVPQNAACSPHLSSSQPCFLTAGSWGWVSRCSTKTSWAWA